MECVGIDNWKCDVVRYFFPWTTGGELVIQKGGLLNFEF